MLSYETAVRRIVDHFKEQWEAGIPVAYPNEREDFGDVEAFARLTVKPSNGRHAAMGARKHRRQGTIIIQVFVRENTGVSLLGALEEHAARAFLGNPVSDIRCFDIGANRIGSDGFGYYQSNVNIVFQYDTN